jgi:hypothetical protein
MDREGKLFSYEECIEEFKQYDIKNNFYSSNVKEITPEYPPVATIRPQ